MRLPRLAAVVVSLGTAGSLAAQPPVGVGVGVWAGPGFGYGPWPGYGWPGYGYGPRVGPWIGPGYGWWPWYPSAYGSQWSNGLSLYGPPVPTFGGTPGASGGPDAHNTWRPFAYGPAKDFPSLALPAGYGGPRFATRDVRQRYDQLRVDPTPAVDQAYRDLNRSHPWRYPMSSHPLVNQPGEPSGVSRRVSVSANALRVVVKVPTADAAVWLDGQPMASSGTERTFDSPPLSPGQAYQYQVTARWGPNTITSQTAAGKPGETVELVFGK